MELERRIYLPGEIIQEHRGTEVVTITKGRVEKFDTFQYPLGSEEFTSITGVRAAQGFPIVRIYFGLSRLGADVVTMNEGPTAVPLEQIDKRLIIPYFLEQRRKAKGD